MKPETQPRATKCVHCGYSDHTTICRFCKTDKLDYTMVDYQKERMARSLAQERNNNGQSSEPK